MKRFTRRTFWIAYFLLFIATFLAVNARLRWLGARIIPFSAPVDLVDSGQEYRFHLNSFATDDYTLMLSLAAPGRSEAEVLAVFDMVTFSVVVKNTRGEEIFEASAPPVSKWTITNSTPLEGPSGYSFYPSSRTFRARSFATYEMIIRVESGDPRAAMYKPQLLFHGIDDGCFWLRKQVDNILVIALFTFVGLVAASVQTLGAIRRRRRDRAHRCRSCGYELRGLTGDYCPECGEKWR